MAFHKNNHHLFFGVRLAVDVGEDVANFQAGLGGGAVGKHILNGDAFDAVIAIIAEQHADDGRAPTVERFGAVEHHAAGAGHEPLHLRARDGKFAGIPRIEFQRLFGELDDVARQFVAIK